jgi:hypothetical protein
VQLPALVLTERREDLLAHDRGGLLSLRQDILALIGEVDGALAAVARMRPALGQAPLLQRVEDGYHRARIDSGALAYRVLRDAWAAGDHHQDSKLARMQPGAFR